MELIRETLSDSSGCFEFIKPKDFIDGPVISVVMSVCNGEKYLHESIDSVLNQTYTNFEFIIINDGSNDGSLDILLKYQKKDNRILLINQRNIGLTRSLNRGIKLAAGEYIARQDADDISAPSRLEKQLNYIKSHSEVAVVACLRDLFTADGTVRKTRDPKFSRAGIKRYLESNNLFMHGEVLMRKSCLEKVGFYREFFCHSQDYDLWLRLSQHFDLDIVPEHLYRYRITTDAISISLCRAQEQYAQIARELHAERLETGKDSYDTLISSYPNGLPVQDAVDRCEYHFRVAEELINANRLNQARKELWKAWKLRCRRRRLFSLFLKTLLGAKLLDIYREFKNLKFRI